MIWTLSEECDTEWKIYCFLTYMPLHFEQRHTCHIRKVHISINPLPQHFLRCVSMREQVSSPDIAEYREPTTQWRWWDTSSHTNWPPPPGNGTDDLWLWFLAISSSVALRLRLSNRRCHAKSTWWWIRPEYSLWRKFGNVFGSNFKSTVGIAGGGFSCWDTPQF